MQIFDDSPFKPMRVVCATGAILLVDTPQQAQSLPETLLEPTGDLDLEGRLIFKEVDPKRAADAALVTLAEELKVAAQALYEAAHALKEGPGPRIPAARAHMAAKRAEQAFMGLTQEPS
jgi:hypothetical protein